MIARTKKEALELGQTRFFTGKVCKNGHLDYRNMSHDCISCKKIYSKKWKIKNRFLVNKHARDSTKRNKLTRNEKIRIDRKLNPKKRIKHNMYSHIRKFIRVGSKRNFWNRVIEYNIEDLMNHLEKLFTNSMTWDNYGDYWELDHIVPVTKIITNNDISQLKYAWRIKNLQPLEKHLNRIKGNRFSGNRENIIQKEKELLYNQQLMKRIHKYFKYMSKYLDYDYRFDTITLMEKLYIIYNKNLLTER